MLIISSELWQYSMHLLRHPPHDCERVAYFDGPRADGDIDVATTITVPQAAETEGNFQVAADEMRRAGRHLRHHGLIRMAQVHTHPFDWTGHSGFDDEMAFSQRDGAISIVVPNFAGCAPGLADCGVHLRTDAGWQELSHEEKSEHVRIVPALIDLRR